MASLLRALRPILSQKPRQEQQAISSVMSWQKEAEGMFEDYFARIGKPPLAGTLPLTAELISSLYGLPHRDEPNLEFVLRTSQQSWPWSASFSAAPRETAMAVNAMLREVMLATPDLDPATIDTSGLNVGTRARLHLDALVELWRTHPEVMPAELLLLRDFLSCTPADALQNIVVIGEADTVSLPRLERAVLARLAEHHPSASAADEDYQRLVGHRREPGAPAHALVGHIQRNLLSACKDQRPVDASFAVLSVRDSLSECEAALAIVQSWQTSDPTLQAGDIAVFVPDGTTHASHLGALARRTGIVLSGLPAAAGGRNVGAETVHLFLLCCRRPAPAMARASLFASPVMPWGKGQGPRMARMIIKGRRPAEGIALDETGQALLDLLQQGEPKTNKALRGRLATLQKLLGFGKDDVSSDLFEAKGHIAFLLKDLSAQDDEAVPDWPVLLEQAAAHRLEPLPRGERYLGAITVMHSREMPRRHFRKVLMLGFNEGVYPSPPARNPIFLDSEIDAIEKATSLSLSSRSTLHDRALERLQRQICAAQEELVLLCSERDGMGKPLFPASSLALMARLVEGLEKPEDIVASLGQSQGTAWDRLVDWRDAPEYKSEPRPVPPPYLALGRNLLHLRCDVDGNPLPQSPSRLEKLLVSPMAWLLDELDAGHVSWQPESLDVSLRGTLAHGVFEHLFKPGIAIAANEEITSALPDLMSKVIGREASFLALPEWRMEREALEADILKAALAWAQTLRDLGAEIVSNEFWLEGEVLGHPVHGKADTLLRLGDGQVVIVDHKKSSSGARRIRMEQQSDLQVELYRRMRVKPPAEASEDPHPVDLLLGAAAGSAGVAYHTMNDSAVLVNGIAGQNGGQIEIFSQDISQRAMAQLSLRFEALRAGRLETNSTADAKHFSKRLGLGIYALDESPLIRAFMREDDSPSAFAKEEADD